MIKKALLLLHDDLFVGEGGAGDGTPVDHTSPAIDQFLLEKVDKDLLHASRVGGIHGEALPRPVTRGAHFFKLLDDDAAVLFLPLPDLFEEFLSTEVVPVPDFSFFL